MDETKKNRLIAASTVAAVLLAVILAVVLICQVATLVNRNNEKIRLQNEIRMYEEKLANAEDELAYLESWEYLEHLLTWYNYHPNN